MEDYYKVWLQHMDVSDIKLLQTIYYIIVKQWKRPRTIYRNLQVLNKIGKCRFSEEEIFKRQTRGWDCTGNAV